MISYADASAPLVTAQAYSVGNPDEENGGFNQLDAATYDPSNPQAVRVHAGDVVSLPITLSQREFFFRILLFFLIGLTAFVSIFGSFLLGQAYVNADHDTVWSLFYRRFVVFFLFCTSILSYSTHVLCTWHRLRAESSLGAEIQSKKFRLLLFFLFPLYASVLVLCVIAIEGEHFSLNNEDDSGAGASWVAITCIVLFLFGLLGFVSVENFYGTWRRGRVWCCLPGGRTVCQAFTAASLIFVLLVVFCVNVLCPPYPY